MMLQRSEPVTSVNTLAVLVIGVFRIPAQGETMSCCEKKASADQGAVYLRLSEA